jgi:preprotein translocase subunit SecY
VPGIDTKAVDQIQNSFGGGGILNLLNTFTGGGLSRLALFALGIMPYITASIILQLLTVVSPALEKLQKEGEVGQARITQYTRYLTVGLAAAQAIGYTFLFKSEGAGANTSVFTNFNAGTVILVVLCLTAGLGDRDVDGRADHPARHRQRHLADDLRLDRGRLPQGVQSWWTNPDPVFKIIMPFLAVGVVAAVVYIQEGQRRIPIQYAKRVIGRRMSSGGQTYLPLRVNMAGVIPVIFAASIMAFPPRSGSSCRR